MVFVSARYPAAGSSDPFACVQPNISWMNPAGISFSHTVRNFTRSGPLKPRRKRFPDFLSEKTPFFKNGN